MLNKREPTYSPIKQTDPSRDLQDDVLRAPPAKIAWLWGRTSMLKEVWDVLQSVETWPGVVIEPDSTGLCLTLNGVRLGHLRWDGRIDLPFGAELGDQLVIEEMASRDPERPDAGRVVFDVRTVADVDHAVWLLRLAYLSTNAKADVPCS